MLLIFAYFLNLAYAKQLTLPAGNLPVSSLLPAGTPVSNSIPCSIVEIAYNSPDAFCGSREKAYQSVGYFLEREDLYDLIRNCIPQEEEMVDLSESNS